VSKITLRFYRNGSFSSRLIELTGRYSHVDAVSSGGHFLFGARSDKVGNEPPGVRDRNPYAGGPYEDLSLVVGYYQETCFWNFLWGQVGKPYDYRCILGFLFDRDWHEDDSWICSELQMAALQAGSIIPKLIVTPNKITPGTLAVAFGAIGAVKT